MLLMLATDELLLLPLYCLPTWFNPFFLYLTERKELVAPLREPLAQQLAIEAYSMLRLFPHFHWDWVPHFFRKAFSLST